MLKKVLNFFLFSNVYVAMPVTCMAWQTFLLLKKDTNWILLVYVYLATLFLYCFHRLYKLEKEIQPFHSERHVWAIKHRISMNSLTIISGIGALVCSLFLPAFVFYWLAVPAVIGLGYTLPLLPYKNGFVRLRDLPFVKVILIALVVAWVTVMLPIVLSGYALNWLMLAERFFFILAITIPFDIRDMQYDKENKLWTFPVTLGVKTAKAISLVSLLLFLILACYSYSGANSVALGISAIVASAVIWFAHPNRSEYYFSFLVEGLMIVQFVCVYVIVFF